MYYYEIKLLLLLSDCISFLIHGLRHALINNLDASHVIRHIPDVFILETRFRVNNKTPNCSYNLNPRKRASTRETKLNPMTNVSSVSLTKQNLYI